MTLNGFIKRKPRKRNLKAAIKTMRSKWLEGTYENFVDRLARVLGCSHEEAKAVFEYWLKAEFVKLDDRGLVTWRNVRGF
jgi:hypothetical protein